MAASAIHGTVLCGKTEVPYILVHKSVKNVNIHLQEDGTAVVSAPRRVPKAEVECILQQKSSFLQSAHRKLQEHKVLLPPKHQYQTGEQFRLLGQIRTLQNETASHCAVSLQGTALLLQAPAETQTEKRQALLQKWLRTVCFSVFGDTARQAENLLQDKPIPQAVTLRIRRMTSRWGSCIPAKHIITLSTRLLETPLPCVQAVVLHEYVHFLHPDHSPFFYAELESIMPDYRSRVLPLKSPAYSVFYNE